MISRLNGLCDATSSPQARPGNYRGAGSAALEADLAAVTEAIHALTADAGTEEGSQTAFAGTVAALPGRRLLLLLVLHLGRRALLVVAALLRRVLLGLAVGLQRGGSQSRCAQDVADGEVGFGLTC